ncbi:hypothetical protein CY34DRAFT_812788 [Suillus luteus UH-Slu-Lm8-n1]|uniref:Uncharacterized protein n=1 Tax=Suillus luteus UH-Slu-Lm8-n1 TaxID=930992 RepID=A0A0C9ZAS3_9AGAM|nr:hypothetical protein CY34DRAFT_812788 [Suillus luteus UH-Slu-Lm8-n1]
MFSLGIRLSFEFIQPNVRIGRGHLGLRFFAPNYAITMKVGIDAQRVAFRSVRYEDHLAHVLPAQPASAR